MASTLTDFDHALKHKYRIEPGGEFVPGVTTVINILDKGGLKWSASGIAAQTAVENSRKKRGIVNVHRQLLSEAKGKSESAQRKRLLAETGTDNDIYIHWCRGEFDRQWKAKAARGTRVHDVAEQWSKHPTEPVDVLLEDSKFVDALELFHKRYKPKFLYTECIVTNNALFDEDGNLLPYGGRFDFIAELDGPEAEGVFMGDYKSGGKYPYEVALQAEGYMNAELATFNADGSLGIPKPLPELDGARTIYLEGEGNVSVSDPFEKITRGNARKAFKACRQLFEVNKVINAALDEWSDSE